MDTLVVLRLQLPKLDGNVVEDGGGHDDELVIVGPEHPEDRERPLPPGKHVLAHLRADGREVCVEQPHQSIVQSLPVVHCIKS